MGRSASLLRPAQFGSNFTFFPEGANPKSDRLIDLHEEESIIQIIA